MHYSSPRETAHTLGHKGVQSLFLVISPIHSYVVKGINIFHPSKSGVKWTIIFLLFPLFIFGFSEIPFFLAWGREGHSPVRLAATVSHVEARIIAEYITKSRISRRRALRSFVSCTLYENDQVLR